MKKTFALLVAAFLLISCLASCQAPDTATEPAGNSDPTQGTTPQAQPALYVRLPWDVPTFDPHLIQGTPEIIIANNLYSKLLRYAEDTGAFEGDLAERWEISENGTRYTFYLREGVSFHDGSKLSADDVVFSTNRLIELGYVTTFISCGLVDVKAVDELTVEYTLAAPYLPFLDSLSYMFYIVSEDYVTGGHDVNEAPMGTGPYRFVSATAGYEVVLTAFADYYGGEPEVKNVVCRIMEDVSSVIAALETGELSYAAVPFSYYPTLSSHANISVTLGEPYLLYAAVFNYAVSPFSDARVRQAFNYAVDRDNMTVACSEGFGSPASFIILSSVIDFPDVGLSYVKDVDKAKQLLADAGYADGFTVQALLDPSFEKAGIMLQADLQAIGITLEIQTTSVSALVSSIFTGEYEMALLSLSVGNNFDAWRILIEEGGAFNVSGYSNSRINELLPAAVSAASREEARQMYGEVLAITFEECPYLPLYEDGDLNALSNSFAVKRPLSRLIFLDFNNFTYSK